MSCVTMGTPPPPARPSPYSHTPPAPRRNLPDATTPACTPLPPLKNKKSEKNHFHFFHFFIPLFFAESCLPASRRLRIYILYCTPYLFIYLSPIYLWYLAAGVGLGRSRYHRCAFRFGRGGNTAWAWGGHVRETSGLGCKSVLRGGRGPAHLRLEGYYRGSSSQVLWETDIRVHTCVV